MSAQFSRRHLLTAAPAAGLTAMMAGAVPVEAVTETPVAALFREWTAARATEAAIYAATDDEDEHNRAWDAAWDAEKRLLAAPSQCAADVLMKLAAWSRFGTDDSEASSRHLAPVWAEARVMVG